MVRKIETDNNNNKKSGGPEQTISKKTTNTAHKYPTRSRVPNIDVDYTAIEKIGTKPPIPVKKTPPKRSKKNTNPIAIIINALSKQEDKSESDNEESDEQTSDTDESWTYEYNAEEVSYLKNIGEERRLELMGQEMILMDLMKQKIPLRFRIIQSDIDDGIKHIILKKLKQSEESCSEDATKLAGWVESLSLVPFNIYKELGIKMDDGQQKIHDYLLATNRILNESIYGHQQTKVQILEYITQYITNPKSRGKCLAIQGPPGNGKTTLVRNGIAKAIGRPFTQISLGGMSDVSILDGHDFTYTGSQCGRIVESLKETGVMNPIIYFDELDKVSSSSKGADIYNFLCHLTDFSQNMAYHDRYFSGINFDLSKAIFIFSFNDITAINPILLDRLHVIETKGFGIEDKIQIAKEYLLKQVVEEVGLKREDIIMEDDVIREIVTTYCVGEEGVRLLKRTLETIISRLNILRFTLAANGSGESIPLPYNIDSVEFPMRITNRIAESLLKSVNVKERTYLNMYL
jgi:ATP-dependent Lon protease